MNLSSIIGQPLAVNLCERWLARNTNQPLLFFGPEGCGKRTLALEVAKALNCASPPTPLPKGEGGRRPGEAVPCGRCIACKKISAGHHPDVRVIDRTYQALQQDEPVEKQQALKIETILQERHRLFQSSVEAPWKVSVIDDAHRLTPDAANVLLKILEEPPAQTALFLLTPYRDRLFQTILSRCQPVRFKPLTDNEMKKCLSTLQIRPDQQMRLIELALGSPGRAMHLNREDQIESLRWAEALWQELPKETTAGIFSRTEGRSKATRPTRTDIEEKVASLLLPAGRALRSGDPAAVASIALIQKALTRLRQNVQPALVYDYLLVQLAQARQ